MVRHVSSGAGVYGSLVAEAATLPVPDPSTVTLKQPSEYTLIGREIPRRDVAAKVHGTATFGIDVRLPGMLFASVERCPYFGGALKSVDERAARGVPGVRDVRRLDPVTGPLTRLPSRVAVLGQSTWAAFQGRRALGVEWDVGPAREFSTAALSAACRSSLDDHGLVAFTAGAPPDTRGDEFAHRGGGLRGAVPGPRHVSR